MNEEDRLEWVRSQFNLMHTQQEVRWVVEQLLSTLWAQTETHQLNADSSAEVVKLFAELAAGHALVTQETHIWDEAKPGRIFVGQHVRTRLDAYSGDVGREFNGLEGQVATVRGLDVQVRYPSIGNRILRQNPEALEILVR